MVEDVPGPGAEGGGQEGLAARCPLPPAPARPRLEPHRAEEEEGEGEQEMQRLSPHQVPDLPTHLWKQVL